MFCTVLESVWSSMCTPSRGFHDSPFDIMERLIFPGILRVKKQRFVGFEIRMVHRWPHVRSFQRQFCKLFCLVCVHQATVLETAVLTLRKGSFSTVIWGVWKKVCWILHPAHGPRSSCPKRFKQFCKVFHFECAHQATGSRTNTLTLRNYSFFTGCWS